MKQILSRLAGEDGPRSVDKGRRVHVAEGRQPVAADDSHRAIVSRPRVVRMVWAAGGFLAFGLGALGAVLPLLPTIPFLLGATFCFARSSKVLDQWFRSTKLYREVLQGYVARRAMTLRSKVMLLAPIMIALGISFALMASVPVGRAVVTFIAAAHILYFCFVVGTVRGGSPVADADGGR